MDFFSLKKNKKLIVYESGGIEDSWEMHAAPFILFRQSSCMIVEIASLYFWHMVQVFSMECEEDQSLIHQAYVKDSFTVRTIKIHW